jgi:release factor glutamine methyltransferase
MRSLPQTKPRKYAKAWESSLSVTHSPARQIRTLTLQRLTEAGIENPAFEAQILLTLALGISRATLLAEAFPEPTTEQREALERLLHAREERVPLAYLRGTQEFYGFSFRVSPAVLIPRPETELLVDFALERLQGIAHPRFIDVGTGSGCIAISVLKSLPQATALAVDLSKAALALAQENAVALGVQDRLTLVQGNLLTGVQERVHLVLSNPPYIPTAEIPTLQPEVQCHEPHLALDGGGDGLVLIRELLAQAWRNLEQEGWIVLEVAQGQAHFVEALLRHYGYANVASRCDLAGIPRMVFGQSL